MYPNVLWGPESQPRQKVTRTCINYVLRVSRGFRGILSPEVQSRFKIYFLREFEKIGFLPVFDFPVPRKMFPKWILFCNFDFFPSPARSNLIWPTQTLSPCECSKSVEFDPWVSPEVQSGTILVFFGGAILGTFYSVILKKVKNGPLLKNPKFFLKGHETKNRGPENHSKCQL